LEEIRLSPVGLPVRESLKAAMGKRTRSMRMGGAGGLSRQRDGTLFTDLMVPPGLHRPMSRDGGKVFPVTQEVLANAYLVSSTSITVFNSTSFNVGSLDQIASLTALFDQYRIVGIETWLVPEGQPASGADNGELATVIDYDDATMLSSFASALDYENVVVSNGAVGHYRKWKPHAAIAAYSGAFTSYANEESPWLDAASTGVLHYGQKMAITATTSSQSYDLVYRLHTEWRNFR